MCKRRFSAIIAISLIIMIFCNACVNVSFSAPDRSRSVAQTQDKAENDQNWPDGQEEGLIPVDGGQVLYHYYGKDKPGIPIIFLHGGPGADGTCFFKQTALADTHPIVIFNQLGSVGSPFNDDITTADEAKSYLTIEHFVEEVQTVVDYFDFKEFIICGRSWGTMLAVEYVAAKQPAGLKGIVLDGPFLNVDRWCDDAERLIKSLDNGEEYWRIVKECEASGDFDSPEYKEVNKIYSDNFYSRVEGANDGTPVDKPAAHVIPDLSVYEYMWGPSEFSCMGTLKGHDSTPLLADIDVPILYICGQYDSGTPEAANWYLSMTKNGELCVLPGCGHNASRERPVEFNAVVGAFANRVCARNNKNVLPVSGVEEYTITRVNGDIDWSSIPELQIDKVLWTDDYGIRAKGQLCYDDENLYVRLAAVEKEIRAENTEPLSPVYEDSCLEFFFMMPESSDYFNCEINPNGVLNIEFGPEKTDRIDLVRRDAKDYFDIKTDRIEDGWEAYYRIPLKFVRLFYPDYEFKGDIIANMCKCGNKTANKHYISWTQIDLPEPNFHCPQYFGKMHFE